jgi:cobalamin biosynthesis Mg chelatase CobN
MRRITSHISLIAVLATLCLAGTASTNALAATDSSTSVNKAALNKAVQEALAKSQGGASTGASAGAQNSAAAGASSGELGSSEAFSNLTGKAQEEEASTATTATTATSASSGISTGVVVPIGIVSVLLLGGIAFFIVRDSRSMAPIGDGLRSGPSPQEQAARRRKRRAKAKAARQQRKRNR